MSPKTEVTAEMNARLMEATETRSEVEKNK